MAQTIDKLLALAAVEHRQRIEDPVPVDLVTLVRDIAESAAPRLRTADVRLDVEADEGLPPLSGDAFLLRQMLGNLLDNAIDFSPRGGVVDIALSCGDSEVRIEVADRGPGVPDYALGRVFERFYSLPRPDGGGRSSGLGLPFVVEVAELHGGRVVLANRDGGGAVASVVLPL
jgi:two-component system sensor histidine kinase CreC